MWWPGWESQLLSLLGAPVTQQNIAFLDQWALQEEPSASAGYAYNPLNVEANGALLQFSSPQQGIAYTANFMQHGYNDVIAALRSGNPTQYNLSSSLGSWSNGGYHSINVPGTSPGTQQVPAGAAASAYTTPLTQSGASGGGLFGNSWFGQIESGIASSAILLGGILLVGIGGLWIAFSSKDVRDATATAGKAALSAA